LTTEELPRIYAARHPDRVHILTEFCPDCRTVHMHGVAGGFGSRASHCYKRSSPMYGKVYELVEVSWNRLWSILDRQVGPIRARRCLEAA
jgi:hypothetical protein